MAYNDHIQRVYFTVIPYSLLPEAMSWYQDNGRGRARIRFRLGLVIRDFRITLYSIVHCKSHLAFRNRSHHAGMYERRVSILQKKVSSYGKMERKMFKVVSGDGLLVYCLCKKERASKILTCTVPPEKSLGKKNSSLSSLQSFFLLPRV